MLELGDVVEFMAPKPGELGGEMVLRRARVLAIYADPGRAVVSTLPDGERYLVPARLIRKILPPVLWPHRGPRAP